MKYLVSILMLALVGCTSATPHGKCIGINDKEDPKLEYKYSGWNIGVGIVFAEMIIPPIVVILDELKCPVGAK
jgi:hypothetical protein